MQNLPAHHKKPPSSLIAHARSHNTRCSKRPQRHPQKHADRESMRHHYDPRKSPNQLQRFPQNQHREGKPVYNRNNIQELQQSSDSERAAPKELSTPETQHTDHSQVSSQDVNRDFHHLVGVRAEEQGPDPADKDTDATSDSVERPVVLGEAFVILQEPLSVSIDV